MAVRVPTTAAAPSYRQTSDLGTGLFRLEFHYSGREDAWYVSVLASDGTELVMGRKLRVAWPLLGQFVGDALPAGVLEAPDRDGTFAEPGRNDLGSRIELEFEAAE